MKHQLILVLAVAIVTGQANAQPDPTWPVLKSYNGHYFWSDGYAFGTFDVTTTGSSKSVKISMLQGQLSIASVQLTGSEKHTVPKTIIKEGDALEINEL